MAKEYDFPVWGTQGGGLVLEEYDGFYFIEAPDCPGLGVGDAMPEEWDIIPSNKLARDVESEAEDASLGPDLSFMHGEEIRARRR